MSTYSALLKHQTPFAVHVTSGSFGATEAGQKFRLTIPADWDHFWDNTRTDFFDVVLTAADGVSKLTFGRVVGASHANRVLQLDVDGWTAPSGKAVCLLWLHYGDNTATVDPAPGAAPTSPPAASLTLALPGGWMAAHRVPRSGQARDVFTKRSDEIRDLWVRFPELAQRRSKSRGVLGLEWPSYLKVDVLDDAVPPVAQPSMTTFSRFRFAGSQFVRVDLRLGSSGTRYTVTVTLTTTLGQRLVYPATLHVLDS